MVFENIEKLKSNYTDKFVVVDESRPELLRFRGLTGQVKTVNMSGRALVQFEGHNNIGWFDIEIPFLKVVDRPPPKEEKKAEAKPAKAAAPKAEAPKAEAKPAAKPSAGGMSVDEMMALARGKAPAAKPASAPAKKEPAAKPTTSAGDAKKLSVEEMLAAARNKGTPAAQSAATSKPATGDDKKSSVADILAAARTMPAAVAEAPAAPEKPVAAKPAAKASGGKLPTEVADIVALCRKTDTKS